MSVIKRNNVKPRGHGDRPMVFAHGFGCDQNMWRLVAPAFEFDFQTVLFDHVGAGDSDLYSLRHRRKYARRCKAMPMMLSSLAGRFASRRLCLSVIR